MLRTVKLVTSVRHKGIISCWGIGLRLLFSGLITGAAVVYGTELFFLIGFPAQDASTNQMGVRVIIVDSAGKAERILERLKSGQDFAVLAREESVDPSGINGGILGKPDTATLEPELRDALKGLEPGQLSHIVKIPSGYAILKSQLSSEVADLEQADRFRLAPFKARVMCGFRLMLTAVTRRYRLWFGSPGPNGWDQDLQAICDSYNQSFSVSMEGLEELLSSTSEEGMAYVKNAKPLDVMQAQVPKGQLHAYIGEMTKAIEEGKSPTGLRWRTSLWLVPQMDEMLGVGYLHKSEMENDVYRNPGRGAFFLCLRRSDTRKRPVPRKPLSISSDISPKSPTSSK